MIGQSDVVHSPLALTRMDITHIISLRGQAGLDQGHLHIGLQGHAQIIIIVYISSVVLQGNWTEFPVGFLFTARIGVPVP